MRDIATEFLLAEGVPTRDVDHVITAVRKMEPKTITSDDANEIRAAVRALKAGCQPALASDHVGDSLAETGERLASEVAKTLPSRSGLSVRYGAEAMECGSMGLNFCRFD